MVNTAHSAPPNHASPPCPLFLDRAARSLRRGRRPSSAPWPEVGAAENKPVGKRRHAASGRLGRGCPRLRLGPQEARAAPPPASSLQLFRRRGAALRQAAAALYHTRCTCRAACRLRVPVEHAADRRLRGRKITGLPARARHDERRAPPCPVRSRAYHPR
eukprot:scaffold51092_cov44-Phaeocystis_antarctica.AAC.1